MPDYITPEYVEYAKLIRDQVEPAVGMWFNHRDDHIEGPRLIVGNSQTGTLAKHRDDYLCYPDLGWLARRLAKDVYFVIEPPGDEHGNEWLFTTWALMDDIAVKPDFQLSDNTPELACIKALCHILGREPK